MESVFLIAHRSLKFGQSVNLVHILTSSHRLRVRDGKIIGTRLGEARRKGLCQLQACTLSHFCRVWLLATPLTAARQAPLSMGILQRRIPGWVAISFSSVNHMYYKTVGRIFLLLRVQSHRVTANERKTIFRGGDFYFALMDALASGKGPGRNTNGERASLPSRKPAVNGDQSG